MILTAWLARGSSWSWDARGVIRNPRRQALLPQPFCVRDSLYLDALPHQVLNFALLPKDLYQDKCEDSSIDSGFHCDGMGYRSGMYQDGVRFGEISLSVAWLGLYNHLSVQPRARLCKCTTASHFTLLNAVSKMSILTQTYPSGTNLLTQPVL